MVTDMAMDMATVTGMTKTMNKKRYTKKNNLTYNYST